MCNVIKKIMHEWRRCDCEGFVSYEEQQQNFWADSISSLFGLKNYVYREGDKIL